ncbi:DUF3413 domain-containing protein [Vibrio sp. SCSIO 43136]|uniref:DUF3413 domain-containing protein n=1 Tax=Vibrio sp. SCSIO 43136 TaxID=2819101 RepID=UPI0020750B9B|nr:DUF3413 domain-containing protein [Vibrio sp. SCSIO 43136]USD66583.1 DUF3413 domain-containing protein [Vibrio sp. SCSIO 43136]
METLKLRDRLHSYGWFILANAILSVVIAGRYYTFMPKLPSDALGITFMVSSIISQMSLLIGLVGLLAMPLILLPTKLRRTVVALFGAVGIATLFIDTMVFAQYRFHINLVVVNMLLSGGMVSFPISTWLIVIGSVVGLLVGQYFLISKLEQQPKLAVMKRKLGLAFSASIFVLLLVSHGTHIWSAANVYQPVTAQAKYLPVFYPTTANDLMAKYGMLDVDAVEREKAMRVKSSNNLNYPTEPLVTKPVDKPLNIMILAIDSWRYDTFNEVDSPNLWKYAQRGQVLPNHIASGNATRMGIFGLFYGMPGTYWHSFLANQQSPVLMDRLQELNYDLGIFSAAHLRSPRFKDTVFAKVEDLRLESKGSRPSELDQNVTDEWLEWYDSRDTSQPAFSFIFYDSPHGYDFPKDYSTKFEPAKPINYLNLDNDTDTVPLMNWYRTSVHYTDSLAGQILDKLEATGDLDNTIIIITADHGQELNDNKLNYWGHNSNYTDPQVRVPFAIIAPGITSDTIELASPDALTSHEDVAPTLMKNWLGVESDIATYSTGLDLLDGEVEHPFVVASMWANYGLVTKERILDVGVGGQTTVMDKGNKVLEEESPNYEHVRTVLERMSRFQR